jgi:hypothetical protein
VNCRHAPGAPFSPGEYLNTITPIGARPSS